MIVITLIIVSLSFFVSASFLNFWDRITGRATEQEFTLNLSVGSGTVPQIVTVWNNTAGPVDLSEGPDYTTVYVNFTVYDADGSGNINDSSAYVNITLTGNLTTGVCSATADFGTDYVNYSCSLNLSWYTDDGDYAIMAYVGDLSANYIINTSTEVHINTQKSFEIGPNNVSWAQLTAGTYNLTSNSDPLELNNTGNQDIASGSVRVNATDLLGENDDSKGIWAGNMTVGTVEGGSPTAECGTDTSTFMSNSVFTAVSGSTLGFGNYTVSDGTGQENLYFCITQVGSELSSQPYSTSTMGGWTADISA